MNNARLNVRMRNKHGFSCVLLMRSAYEINLNNNIIYAKGQTY